MKNIRKSVENILVQVAIATRGQQRSLYILNLYLGAKHNAICNSKM